MLNSNKMKSEICIEFAEWVGMNTFPHDISINGIYRWRLYKNNNYIMTNDLYEKFCNIKNIKFTIQEQLLEYQGKFEPTNFIEYISKRGLFYYMWSYKGVTQEPYWTTGKNKYRTDELYNDFKTKN